MNKEELLSQLMKLNVRCVETLEKYVDYCFIHNQHAKIDNITSHHHILPKAKSLPFKKYDDLKINSWNGVHLKNYNHYFAHWLLFKALDESSMAFAFFKMHNTGISKLKLSRTELLSEDMFLPLYKSTFKPWNKGKVGLQVAWNKGLLPEKQPFFGKNISPIHKQKISESNSGNNNYWRNNPMTNEHKLKNSEANKNIIKTQEWNKKNSERRTGSKLMNNSIKTQYVQKEEIEFRLSNGWVLGRC